LILSIIIPVYNVESYLRQCLDSVFIQTDPGFEVICVNDGSSDGSSNILEEFQQRYPVLKIIDRENKGLSAARNSGLTEAKGEYIYFLDSDDYFLPGVLKNMLIFSKDNQLDIACFNASTDENRLYFNNKTDFAEIITGISYYTDNYRINGFFPPSAVWLYMYRAAFLKENNLLFKEGFIHEDEQFSPRVFYLAKKVKCLNIPVQYHRVGREGAITYEIKERNLHDLLSNSTDILFFLNQKHCIEELFYLKIFENYLFVASKIAIQFPGKVKDYFLAEDYNTMKSCVISWDWYVYYWLFRYCKPVYKWYVFNERPKFLKRIINLGFKFYYWLKSY
jgi:glycosyltransferase involved in cell wall biosynthesis